jgi:type I restriction enzyme S subunit
MTDELPEGWATATVGEMIEDFQPGFASGEKNVENGVGHLRMNNIGLSGELVLDLVRTVPEKLAKPRHNLRRGDVLVCTTNSGKLVGKCAYFDLPGRYAFSNHLTRLRPNPSSVDGKFLRWNLWLQWKSGVFDDKCKHWVNQSTIPKDVLLDAEVALPPLPEQRRIVAKMEKLLDKVEASRKRLANIPAILKRFRQSVLSAACSGRLTTNWREEQNQVAEWPTTTLRAVVQSLDQGWSPKCDIESSPSSDVWGVIKTTAVQAMRFLQEENKRLPDTLSPVEELKLKAGDMLITRAGPRARAGVCCLIRSVRPRLMACDKVYRFRINEALAKAEFIELVLNTPKMVEEIDTLKTGISDSGVNLTQGKFLALELPLPPLPEQHEIVRRVEALFALADRIEARYAGAKAQVDKLTQSLLAKAFRGELVPTEAELARREGRSYESAADLLARIGENGAGKTTPRRHPPNSHITREHP